MLGAEQAVTAPAPGTHSLAEMAADVQAITLIISYNSDTRCGLRGASWGGQGFHWWLPARKAPKGPDPRAETWRREGSQALGTQHHP